MTTGIDGLRRRVQMVRRAMDKHHLPRSWSFLMGEDEDIPDSVRARFGEDDAVYIRHYPKGFLGEEGHQGDYAIGYVSWPGGTLIIHPDGRMEPVKQQGGALRRRQR